MDQPLPGPSDPTASLRGSPDFFAVAFGRATLPVLADPAPDDAVVKHILLAGISAPDHGRLSPWRFQVRRGSARAGLGTALAAAAARRNPDLPRTALDSEYAKAFRAPLVILVAAHLQPHPSIPEIEQVLAVGACVQTMCLAAQALGFCANWKTGGATQDPAFAASLGFAPADRVAALLQIGTQAAPAPRPRRLTLDGLLIPPGPAGPAVSSS